MTVSTGQNCSPHPGCPVAADPAGPPGTRLRTSRANDGPPRTAPRVSRVTPRRVTRRVTAPLYTQECSPTQSRPLLRPRPRLRDSATLRHTARVQRGRVSVQGPLDPPREKNSAPRAAAVRGVRRCHRLTAPHAHMLPTTYTRCAARARDLLCTSLAPVPACSPLESVTEHAGSATPTSAARALPRLGQVMTAR